MTRPPITRALLLLRLTKTVGSTLKFAADPGASRKINQSGKMRTAGVTSASPQSPDPNAKPQIERLREMARELECDESEEAFDAVLRKIAAAGPPAKYEPKKRQGKKAE